jgi:pimeloyl-ACP methyl ester carboxylesterase
VATLLRSPPAQRRRRPAVRCAQIEQRKTQRLTLPVLAVGGAQRTGEGVGNAMKLAADDVQIVVLAGCGHWVAEQAPEPLLAALTAFLAPTGKREISGPLHNWDGHYRRSALMHAHA